MANTTYSMNQYIYEGTEDGCMKKLNHKLLYLDWKIDSDRSPYYRDILIQLQNDDNTQSLSFNNNQSYYLTFGIPRNLNYDLNFSIKLLTNYDGYIYNQTETKYQFIKYISTRRTSDNGTSNSLVCLYQLQEEVEQGKVRSAVRWGAATDVNVILNAAPYTPGEFKAANLTSKYFYEIQDPVYDTAHNNYTYYPYVLYHNRNTQQYWMFGGKAIKKAKYENGEITDPFGEDNILAGENDLVVNWIWQQDVASNMAYYKMIITPQNVANISFNYILLQLERISEDADIITEAGVGQGNYKTSGTHPGVGQSVYGRYVDLDQETNNIIDGQKEKVADTFKIYQLYDLTSNGTLFDAGTNTPITRFGIWSHPELLMSINGEEIQIGSSGYYELNDFNVDSLCVVADGAKDLFTLDYQYPITTS